MAEGLDVKMGGTPALSPNEFRDAPNTAQTPHLRFQAKIGYAPRVRHNTRTIKLAHHSYDSCFLAKFVSVLALVAAVAADSQNYQAKILVFDTDKTGCQVRRTCSAK